MTDRFWSKVDRSRGDDACWTWTAGRSQQGYGWFYFKPKTPRQAHRVAMEMYLGHPIPPRMHVLHRCDNPPCVNPRHLFLGTNAVNVADRVSKGRSATTALGMPGERHPNAKLTEGRVAEIRALLRSGCYSHAQIAALYGVSASLIQGINAGKYWRTRAYKLATHQFELPA